MNTNQSTHHEMLRDDLKAYLDNELTWWRQLQVRRHLANCADCRTEVHDMAQISDQLQAENASAETTFDAALRSRILSDAPTADRTSDNLETPPTRRWTLSRVDVAALGAISLILFAIWFPTTQRARENARRSTHVFNVANNALTTEGGGESYSTSPSAGTFAAREQEKQSGDFRSPNSPLNRDSGDVVSAARAKNSTTADSMAGAAAPAIDTTRRVHKEASIGVAVKNAEVASDAVVKLVQGAGGFIAGNTLTSGADDAKNAAMEIRVPVAKFESVLRQIGELGEVRSKNVAGEDLTERFSNADQARRILVEDLSLKEAQLRAAKERAARKKKTYVPGWEERAELRNLRIQAAQARARVELLRKTTDMSSISVQLQEKATPPGEAGFWQSLNDTKIDAAKSFVGAARIPIAFVIWILAYSPLWLPLLLAWRYFNRAPRNAS